MRKWKISDAQWYAARNYGYGRMKDLGCAVVGLKEFVVMREWEDLGCAAYQSHV